MEEALLEKITILYLHTNNDDIGGADYCLLKLVNQLNRKSFTPIVCLGRHTAIMDEYQGLGIKTYLINMERIKKRKNVKYLLKLVAKFIPTVWKIHNIIKAEGVDLIHGNDLLDLYGPIAGRIVKVPSVQHVRWIMPSHKFVRYAITELVCRLNSKVITVSNGVAREMFSKNCQMKSKVVTCYDWLDMKAVGHERESFGIREKVDIPYDIPLIGCVGRLDPWKGQEIFIRAAAIVASSFPEVRFIVVGGTVSGCGRESYRHKLEKLREDFNLKEKVIITGERKDITNVMKSMDVFVHSSITPDPLPGVVMEAMYCSKPVVAANAGGVPEEVDDGKTGILYDPGNYREMADGIMYLLRNPKVRMKMGRAGREKAERVFNKELLYPKIEGIYFNLMRGTKER